MAWHWLSRILIPALLAFCSDGPMNWQSQMQGSAPVRIAGLDVDTRYEDITFEVYRDDHSLDAELIRACEQGNLKLVRSLLERGANPDALFLNHFYPDGGGEPRFYEWSPLLAAVDTRNLELATLLLEAGVDPNFSGGNEGSAFVQAVNSAQEKMVLLFLAAGAYPQALTYEQAPEHRGVVALLAEAQATQALVYCQVIRDQASPLIRQALAYPGKARDHACKLAAAVRRKDLSLLRQLLRSGPVTDIRFYGGNQETYTALEWAVYDHSHELVELLLQAGAKRAADSR